MKLFVQLVLLVIMSAGLYQAVTHPWPGWFILGLMGTIIGGFAVRELREKKALAAKKRTAELEAEAGVPLVEGLADCAECGKPLVAGARFCTYCRTPTARALRGVCSACGTRNQPDAAWCSQCGARVDGVLPKGLLSLEPPSQTSLVPSARPKRL